VAVRCGAKAVVIETVTATINTHSNGRRMTPMVTDPAKNVPRRCRTVPWYRDLQPYRRRGGSAIVSGMEIDRSGMEVLSRETSLRLLATVPVGRVVVSEHALPVAFPVNFALLDGDVVFRTSTGSKLGAAVHKAVLAFEADNIDPDLCTGWSVLVQGWASLLTRPDELLRAEALGLHSWAPGTVGHFVRIHSEMVTGRRLLGAKAETFAGVGCG
jgi:uncharacterized protein